MTIDYKALAEKLNTLSERLVDSEEHAVEAAIPPIAEEAAEALCTVVSLLDGMAEAKPVAWMDEFGNAFPLDAWKPTKRTSYLDYHKKAWKPLFTHPAPQPQPIDTGFTLDQLADACMWAEIPDSKYESLCIALAEKRKAAPQPQPILSGYNDYGAAIPRIERPCTCHPDDNPPIPCAQQYALNECRAASEPTEAKHPDDAAVDRFAAAMKAKLAEKRAEGRGGWDDPEQCSTTYLAMLLRGHVEKGDPLDVGNFAMMLWNRGGATNEAIDVGIPDLRLTEAQSTIAERRLHHALDELDHGIVANDVREVLDELAVLRAALATRETK